MTRGTCPHCRHPVLRILDADTAALPVTLHPEPVTRAAALVAVAAGHRAVTRETHKRERGGTITRYYAFDTPERIRSQYAKQHPYFVEHTCGHTPETETETETETERSMKCPY